MLVTDLGLFGITPEGFELLENAPGWSPEDIQEHTQARLNVSPELRGFRFRD
jgi:acyl CoA:acetate/3-ketoacid CoA transferase beta subunit